MELKNYFAQDAEGNILGGATCYLYVRGTESLVDELQGMNGSALANPFESDEHGLIQFAAPDGLYDLRVVKESRDYRLRVQLDDATDAAALVSVRKYMTNAQWADANSATPSMNHSAAFAKAIAAAVLTGNKRVYVPPVLGHYNVKEVAVPNDIGLFGYSALPYTAFEVSDVLGVGSAIVMIAGGASLFTWGARNTVEGIVMHGRNRSQDCFKSTDSSTGGTRVRWCGVYRFNRGLGTPSYIGGAVVTESNFSGNSVGITNIIDSRVVGCFINANEGNGVSLLTGANDNSFLGTKNEWNNGNNWEFYQSGNNTVTGGVADRAGEHNFKIGSGAGVSIGTVVTRRAGRLKASGNNLHIESALKVSITGMPTALGPNDDGSGTSSPSTAVFFRGTIGRVTMSGVDMNGATGTPMMIEAGTTFEYLSVRDCPGVKDQFNRPGDMTGSVAVAALSSANLPVKLNPLVTYSRALYRVSVTARNANNGSTILGSAILCVSREAGNAAAVIPVLDWGSSNFGVTGAETISVSLVNLAGDGSSADIAVKSTHPSHVHSANCVLTRIL